MSETAGFIVLWKGQAMRQWWQGRSYLAIPSGRTGTATLFSSRKAAQDAIAESVAYWNQIATPSEDAREYRIRRVVR